jgi:hypothetical protein
MPSHPAHALVARVVTVYGAEWCADCRRARRYSTPPSPYHWIDVAADADVRAMLDAAGTARSRCIAIPTGQVLVEPSDDELANVIGTAACVIRPCARRPASGAAPPPSA